LKFYERVKNLPNERLAKKSFLENLLGNWDSDYLAEICKIEKETGILEEACKQTSTSQLTVKEELKWKLTAIDKWGKKLIRDQVKTKSSLNCMPFPSKGWRKADFVDDSAQSTTIAEFRAGNALLGNRETGFGLEFGDFCDDDGRIVWCPACDYGQNNEHHVIIDCEKLSEIRETLSVGGITLADYIAGWREKGLIRSEEILRKFLGGDEVRDKSVLKKRADVLVSMRDRYLSLWR